jgi:hypothetical protein
LIINRAADFVRRPFTGEKTEATLVIPPEGFIVIDTEGHYGTAI